MPSSLYACDIFYKAHAGALSNAHAARAILARDVFMLGRVAAQVSIYRNGAVGYDLSRAAKTEADYFIDAVIISYS